MHKKSIGSQVMSLRGTSGLCISASAYNSDWTSSTYQIYFVNRGDVGSERSWLTINQKAQVVTFKFLNANY